MVKTCQHTQKIARMVVLKRFFVCCYEKHSTCLEISFGPAISFLMNLMAKFLAVLS